MSYKIEKPDNLVYYITCNPFTQVYHHGWVGVNNCMETGQMFLASSSDKHDAIDCIFENYEINENDEIIGEAREFGFSVGYMSELEAQQVADFSSSFDLIDITYLKHPNRDEWAIPFQSYIFSKLPDGPNKDFLITKHLEVVAQGRSRTLIEMLQEGWIEI